MIKKIFFTLLLALLVFPAFAKNTILVLGDSISAGYGIDTKQGWVALLQERLTAQHYDYTVINASISGDTTSNGIARLPQALTQHQPSITIIELGGNDGLRGLPPSLIKQNLESLIAMAKQANSKILVLGLQIPPNYGPTYTTQFMKIFTDLKKDKNITVVPLFLNMVDTNRNLIQPDGIHPTAEAQPKLLDNMWDALKPLLTPRI
jgi:acyl-CoA thioesterase-1